MNVLEWAHFLYHWSQVANTLLTGNTPSWAFLSYSLAKSCYDNHSLIFARSSSPGGGCVDGEAQKVVLVLKCDRERVDTVTEANVLGEPGGEFLVVDVKSQPASPSSTTLRRWWWFW